MNPKNPPLKDTPENEANRHPWTDSRVDLTLSWSLFRRNFKAFFGIGLFTFLSSLLLNFLTVYLFIVLTNLMNPEKLLERVQSLWFSYLIISLLMFYIFAFSNSSFGLAYDIMSSGDGFAEFKGAFHYFYVKGGYYILLSFLSGFFRLFFLFPERLFPNLSSIGIFLILSGVDLLNQFVWIILIETFPSITHQKSLKRAFQENFSILRKDPKRILRTWGIFVGLFVIPIMVGLNALTVFWNPSYSLQTIWIVILLYLIVTVYSIVVTSLKSLIATRIYNSFEFTKPTEDGTEGQVSVDKYF